MPLLSKIIFNKHDKDGSGSIDASELKEIAYQLGHPMTDAQIAEGLKEIDLDGSGELNYDEFKRWWAQKDRFSQLSGVAAEDEAQASKDEQAAAAWASWLDGTVKHFAYFDKDHSGTIDRNEFKSLYENLKGSGYHLTSESDAMMALDRNGDGEISLKEYIAWLRGMRR
eukprot:TRINITY_DN393_c0_g1_i2.p1 TRINITY_DN393_c0_g1~~TRINITY_DN393_c0_g1_i2.p1  ORF type:complete len:169 (+),score=51.15 TRINITY_DN393_c0_g1_i2:46-552(+)